MSLPLKVHAEKPHQCLWCSKTIDRGEECYLTDAGFYVCNRAPCVSIVGCLPKEEDE